MAAKSPHLNVFVDTTCSLFHGKTSVITNYQRINGHIHSDASFEKKNRLINSLASWKYSEFAKTGVRWVNEFNMIFVVDNSSKMSLSITALFGGKKAIDMDSLLRHNHGTCEKQSQSRMRSYRWPIEQKQTPEIPLQRHDFDVMFVVIMLADWLTYHSLRSRC